MLQHVRFNYIEVGVYFQISVPCVLADRQNQEKNEDLLISYQKYMNDDITSETTCVPQSSHDPRSLASLRVANVEAENVLSPANGMKLWFLLGYLSKMSGDHPRAFSYIIPPPPPPRNPQTSAPQGTLSFCRIKGDILTS